MNSDQTAQAAVVNVPIKRLTLLSDIIFATAMVMMVFSFEIPSKDEIETGQHVVDFFKDRLSVLLIYITSFILTAIYWLKHLERFKYYIATDTSHLWLEIFYLMMLALIPLANALSTSVPNILVIEVFYSLVMFFLGIFAFFSWRYASKNRRLIGNELSEEKITLIRHECLVEPIIAVLAIFVAFIYSELWEATLLLSPVVHVIQKKYTQSTFNPS